MMKVLPIFLPAVMAGLMAIIYLNWPGGAGTSDAEKIGICEAQAWLTGTRGRETTAWEDHLWAAAIVAKFRDDARTRFRICMGVNSAGS